MTNSQDPTAPSADDASEDLVTLQVEVRPEHVALLRRFASREGASVEALASLWLREKLDEAMGASGPASGSNDGGEGE